MTNLLEETLEAIEDSGHTPGDIIFIGSLSSGHECSWAEFCVLANREYNSSYGAAKVCSDLKIFFSDGSSMWRGEYDGSEWWEYGQQFVRPKKKERINTLFASHSCGWEDLAEANTGREVGE